MMRQLKMLLRELVLLGVAPVARAEGPPPEARTALIIGNAAYSFAPLKNPLNDVEAMAKASKALASMSSRKPTPIRPRWWRRFATRGNSDA